VVKTLKRNQLDINQNGEKRMKALRKKNIKKKKKHQEKIGK
jgi:hypothetical protein